MNSLLSDLRFAVRQIRRHPGFALIAAVSLAIGMGATSAVVNAAHHAILRPVPGAGAPDRLVEVVQTNLTGSGSSGLSYQDFLDLRDQVEGWEAMAAFEFSLFSFSLGSEGERVSGMYFTPDYFDVMGLAPAQGRFIAPEEDGLADPAPVVVLGYQFWQERFAGAPDVLGSTVWVNRVPLTVIGVTPEEFTGHLIAFRPDVYLPLSARVSVGGMSPQLLTDRRWSRVLAVGLRGPDLSVERADAQVKAVYARLAEAYPESNASRSGAVTALAPLPAEAPGAVRAFFGVLGAMVFLILAVTCANVAGMLVARNSSRTREMAVRLSIGSGRGRLIRQLMTETIVIFVLGGAAGTAVALWLLGVIPIDRMPLPIQVSLDLTPDPTVLFLALAITLGTGLIFGPLPALQATRMDLFVGDPPRVRRPAPARP